MASKGLSIGVSAEWVPKDGDCSPCAVCKEPIYGKRYNLEIEIAGKKDETALNLCEPCYLTTEENGRNI